MRKPTILSILTALLLLASSFAAQADWKTGLAAFQAGNLDTAAKEFKTIVDAQGEWPGGHYMLGWTYLKQDKHQEAIAHLRKAYELKSDDLSYQLRLGEAYVSAGRYTDAVGFLGKIDTAAVPGNLQGFLAQLKAVAYTKTGQSDRALTELSTAARLSPKDAKVQYQYGTAAYNDGDTAAAVGALAKAVSLASSDREILSAYVKALSRQGRESRGAAKQTAYDKAAAAAENLVKASATYDNLMLLGEARLGAKKYEEAVGTFEQAAGKKPSDWLPHYYTGQAYTASNQYRSAEAKLKLALDKTTNSGNLVKIWKQLGFVYEKQKKYKDAVSSYNEAGDSAGAARAQENQNVLDENKEIDKEAQDIARMQAEQEEIRKALEELKEGKLSDDDDPPPGS